MSEHDGAGRDGAGRDGAGRDVPAADEQALTDLFASLVVDAPASEVSPLEIVKLGRIEQRHALDARIKRFKVVRNVLVAAAFAALVVLIVPHLGSGSAETTAAVSSSSSAAATFAASSGSAPQQGGAVAAASAAPASAAAGSAAAGSAGSGSAGSSSAGSSSPVESGAMSSAAAPASSAMSSGAAVPDAAGATKGVTTKSLGGSASAAATSSAPAGSGAGCPALPIKALAAFRSAFPAGYFGPAGRGVLAMPCGVSQSRLPVAKGNVAVTVTVRKAAVGACRECVPAPGQPGVYLGDTSGRDRLVGPAYVYADGYEVVVEAVSTGSKPAGPTFDQLVAGARAVIKTLG